MLKDPHEIENPDVRSGKHKAVEKALKMLFEGVKAKDARVNALLMCQKVEDLAKKGKDEFTAINGSFFSIEATYKSYLCQGS